MKPVSQVLVSPLSAALSWVTVTNFRQAGSALTQAAHYFPQ